MIKNNVICLLLTLIKMIGLAWCLLASFSALVSADSQPQQYNTFHYANHPYIKYMGHHPGYAQPAAPAPAPAPTPAPYGEEFVIFYQIYLLKVR